MMDRPAAGTNLPNRIRTSLERLAALDEGEFEDLTRGLEQTPPALRSPMRLYSLVSQNSSLPAQLVAEVLDGLMSLAATAFREPTTSAETVKAALDSVVGTSNLEERVRRLLDVDLVEVTLRAIDVALADQRTFLRSRVITSIRPIFSHRDDVPITRPKAALISHSLRIEYQEDGEEHVFSVALDEMDILELFSTLSRAEEKGTSTRSVLSEAGLTYVGIDYDDEKPS